METDDEIVKHACKYFDDGEMTLAEPLLKDLASRYQNHAGLANMLGVIAFKRGNIEVATDLFEKAATITPSNDNFQYNLAQILIASGQLDRAVSTLEHVIALNPSHREALTILPDLRGKIKYGIEFDGWHQDAAVALFRAMQHVFSNRVEGDAAEFGTMSGRTATALAYAISQCNWKMGGLRPACHLHLFDSFEGLPLSDSDIDLKSPMIMTGVWAPGSCSKGILNPTELRKKCEEYLPSEQIHIFKGWFRDTVPEIPDTARFGLIHVDGDLYVSALDALDGLFHRRLISTGAIILFDDWNSNQASPEYGERRAWRELVEKYRITFSDDGGYPIGSRKFIVHSYEN